MAEKVLVKHFKKDTWLDPSKVIAMCEETHCIYFEYVTWNLSEEDWKKVYQIWK